MEKEKTAHTEPEDTGGYLKTNAMKEARPIWWEGLDLDGRKTIRVIPKLDAGKFEIIAGTQV